MKKIIIICPHFPPSNLAAVHRTRLFAQHLPKFGWEPIILTVHEKYYEESLDWNLNKLLPSNLRIEKVNALPITKPRIIGDIGLRGFFQLYKRAKSIIKSEQIDFLFIPIPSFYIALLGRLLHLNTGIKYGIDYIDPWVHNFPGSKRLFSRHWFSTQFARTLEPIALKKASLVTGVADGYYKGVQDRNKNLIKTVIFGAMPYGGEIADHEQVKTMSKIKYLFNKNPDKIQLVYAGAMLPKAYEPLERIFQQLKKWENETRNIELHFIGTGKTPNDPLGFNIKSLAEKYGLWNSQIFEYPKRIPYLDVLIHLNAADGVFILGSIEPHYTPSKVYQAVLSQKPIFAILHEKSSAVSVIQNSKAGIVLAFDGERELNVISTQFIKTLLDYLAFFRSFDPNSVKLDYFNKFSAFEVTKNLVQLISLT